MRYIRASLRMLFIVVSAMICLMALVTIKVVCRRSTRSVELRSSLWRHYMSLLVRVSGVRIYSGQKEVFQQLQRESYVIVANHVSYFDPIVLGTLANFGFIAKKELSSWPLFGRIATLTETIFVQRECLWSRTLALRSLRDKLRHRSYCVFPEGTTTNKETPSSRSWMAGSFDAALKAKSGVICVGIHYQDHEKNAWVDDMELIPHLWQILGNSHLDIFLKAERLSVAEDLSGFDLSLRARQKVEQLCLEAKVDLCRRSNQCEAWPTGDKAIAFSSSPLAQRTVGCSVSLCRNNITRYFRRNY